MLLINFKSDLLYALADLFNVCSEELYFPDCGRVLFVAIVLVMLRRGECLWNETTTLQAYFLMLLKSFREF